jgi:TPP-dependent pyruvate/acetoin dehydrogenase alpha subunit
VEADAKREDSGAKLAKTDANQADAGTAWENPLISNQRLRQIYLAMAQARTLEKTLPAVKRGRATGLGTKTTGTFGLEACLVSAASDLGPGDLVSDALTGGAVELLRGTALSEVLRPGKTARSGRSGARVRDVALVCASAGRLPGASGSAERMWSALGAAAALKAAAQARVEDRAEGGTALQAGVVVVFVLAGELPAALWKKGLKFVVEQQLPVIFVVLPAVQTQDSKTRRTRTRGVSALAQGCGVPALVVDADDAVAIYRVAQESIGHARMGGGAALMECVFFVLEGAAGKVRATEDAIAGLERTLVQRGIASRAWMEREAKAFAKRVAGYKSGSNGSARSYT